MQMCENRKEMSFNLIQDEMQLDKDEVEEFIIDGMDTFCYYFIANNNVFQLSLSKQCKEYNVDGHFFTVTIFSVGIQAFSPRKYHDRNLIITIILFLRFEDGHILP